MRSVIRLQFVDKILDVKVDRCFGDGKAIGDLLVSVPIPNELKDL
jgi:hypothetical protein